MLGVCLPATQGWPGKGPLTIDRGGQGVVNEDEARVLLFHALHGGLALLEAHQLHWDARHAHIAHGHPL